MNRQLKILCLSAAAAVIACVSLLPYKFKLALWFALHEQIIDLVPYPALSAAFGPLVVIHPHWTAHVAAYSGAMLLLLRMIRKLTW